MAIAKEICIAVLAISLIITKVSAADNQENKNFAKESLNDIVEKPIMPVIPLTRVVTGKLYDNIDKGLISDGQHSRPYLSPGSTPKPVLVKQEDRYITQQERIITQQQNSNTAPIRPQNDSVEKPPVVDIPPNVKMTPSDVQNSTSVGITDKCLNCLCTTLNDCKPVLCFGTEPCGIYAITKPYWRDGGKLITKDNSTQHNNVEDKEHRDYLQCINDVKCATETVKGFFRRYKTDCNRDGIVDCQDHIGMHIIGPNGCKSQQLTAIHKTRMDACLK